jgi:choice-of-anchor B domain-containing protein
MKLIEEQRVLCKIEGICPTVKPMIAGARTNCVNGQAAGYDCLNVDLLSFVPLSSLGSTSSADGNDIWGYVDSLGRAYALTGQTDGASIVDITNPENPEILVFIQSALTQNTVWRDIKIYKNMMYIVADRSGHGLQYVNIDAVVSAARAQSQRPFRLDRGSTAYNQFVGRDTRFGNCHNIALNEESGFLYMVGSNQASGGLYMYDVRNVNGPTDTPLLAGSFSNDGYTHDTNCVIYRGPQQQYQGREICFGYNENSLTIVDVTNKGSPVMLSRTPYSQVAYTHQGWITPDHQYVLLNDELDEQRFGINTRTLIWDVRSLTNPSHMSNFNGPTAAIDHNLYIKGSRVYEANYRAGLRVMDITNIGSGSLTQVAFFKTWTGSITASFNGAWSVFPWFDTANFPSSIADKSKVVVVQDIEQGLFVLYVN